jgi:uncharacterized RDD family membrane protein YckC
MQQPQTPPGVVPGQEPVRKALAPKGVGARFLALLLDSVIFGVVLALLTVIEGPLEGGCHSSSFIGLNLTLDGRETFYGLCGYSALLFFGGFMLYFILLEWLWGATLGKMVLGLQVVTDAGEGIGLAKSVIRNLLRFIDALPYCIPYLLAAILVWTSADNQRLGDMAARTMVVGRR